MRSGNIKRESYTYNNDVLPMDRVDSFNDGHGRLEASTTTAEPAVEGNILG